MCSLDPCNPVPTAFVLLHTLHDEHQVQRERLGVGLAVLGTPVCTFLWLYIWSFYSRNRKHPRKEHKHGYVGSCPMALGSLSEPEWKSDPLGMNQRKQLWKWPPCKFGALPFRSQVSLTSLNLADFSPNSLFALSNKYSPMDTLMALLREQKDEWITPIACALKGKKRFILYNSGLLNKIFLKQ